MHRSYTKFFIPCGFQTLFLYARIPGKSTCVLISGMWTMPRTKTTAPCHLWTTLYKQYLGHKYFPYSTVFQDTTRFWWKNLTYWRLPSVPSGVRSHTNECHLGFECRHNLLAHHGHHFSWTYQTKRSGVPQWCDYVLKEMWGPHMLSKEKKLLMLEIQNFLEPKKECIFIVWGESSWTHHF